eukprot:g4696.t1
MQRAPSNGGQVGLAVAVDPSSPERLQHVGTMLRQKRPWPAFLHVGARATDEWEACPTPVQEALAWMATSAVGLLDVASVGPLEPVCQAFKALIEAAEGAAASQDKLQSLVSRCAFLATVFIQHDRAVGPLARVRKPMKDFEVTTNELAAFAVKCAKGGKCRAFFCHRTDKSTLSDFEEALRGVTNDIALVDELEQRQLLLALDRRMRPRSLPEMAAVPAGAVALPHGYVERAVVREAADALTNPEEPRSPYTVVGMGGAGKSVLASAVVRESSVREFFRGGVFWMRVGRGAKNSLLPLLRGLAREMGAAPTDTPHVVPHVLNSLEQVQQHLGAVVASTGNSPRLVVLDDVWEREVVEALLPLGLKVFVTTRDRSVVDVPTGCLKVGDMTQEEAVELLLKASKTVGRPGDAVRTQMTKVVALCGHLPLVLAIAGSMPVVKGNGLTPGAWGKLIEELEDVATKMEASDEDSDSLNVVLETSFNALTVAAKRAFMKTAVLAPGAVASIDMLLNLWEAEDTGGTRDEAERLASKCLLQNVGGGGYRVHDLVLDFVKIKIKADTKTVAKATALQARFLGRLDVLKGYTNPEHGAGNQGLFGLGALWRSVEKLSGDSELEVASYSTSLGELESCEATTAVAFCYSSVGYLFKLQGKFEAAEPLYARATGIWEKALGPEHPAVATALNNRAGLLEMRGKYTEAEPLYERSQAIREKVLGPEHPDVAQSLNNRAGLLKKQGKYDEADLLYLRAIKIGEKTLGPDHPDLATGLNNRAELLRAQGKYDEAEPLYERSQAIQEKVLGLEHPDVARSLNNRAGLLSKQGKYDEAGPLNERSLAIREKALGSEHPDVAQSLNNRAGLLASQGKFSEAEPLYKRTQDILEKSLGVDHPNVATILNNRAGLLSKQGKFAEAQPLFERALAINEVALGVDHPSTITSRARMADLYQKQGFLDKASHLLEEVVSARERVQGHGHPDVASALNNRAGVLKSQGRYADAEPLYERSQAIRETSLGPEHPDVAQSLNNRAWLLGRQGKYDDAEPLYERATEILEKALGHDHPTVATVLNNRARLLRAQGK